MLPTPEQTLFPSVLDCIGRTPVVALSRLCAGEDGRILAKLDCLNPGGSKKDLVARQMLLDAEAEGLLAPGQAVVEKTSGNTGTGLAIACAVTGRPFVAVMSRGNSRERARMMQALGAELVLVDQAPGGVPGQVSGADLDLVETETQRLARERGAFRADQFGRESNRRAHREHTAPALLAAAGGRVDAFCDLVGSGGTYAGCTQAFKAHDPQIRCFVVEPETAAVLAGHAQRGGHRLQGGGYAMRELPMLAGVPIDGYLQVTDAEAKACCRRLAREEGLFVGYSSGANVAAALQLLRGPCRGGTVAVLCCDSGLKYLSTDLWED